MYRTVITHWQTDWQIKPDWERKADRINTLTVAYITAILVSGNVVPSDNKNPSRLEVVETFVWQCFANNAIGQRQQRGVCQTKTIITNDNDLLLGK